MKPLEATRLAVVVSCVDSPRHAVECLKWLKENSDPTITTIVLLDNGSMEPIENIGEDVIIRFPHNVGGNAALPRGYKRLEQLYAGFSDTFFDVVAFVHCDLMIRERGWDYKVLKAFDEDPMLGLAGFVGSPQMDELGGRGSGTMLNYLGDYYEGFGQATTAEVHGLRETGLVPVANLDHCSLIFSTRHIGVMLETAYCPTHFFDRALCAEYNYLGLHVAYIGVSCDHFSGGTGAGVTSQDELIKNWLKAEGLDYDEGINITLPGNPAIRLPEMSARERADVVAYRTSEARFWQRYRSDLHMVPFFVEPDYTKIYWSLDSGRWIPRTEWCDKCTYDQACFKHGVPR